MYGGRLADSFSIIIPDTDSPRIAEILSALQVQTVDVRQGEILVIGSDRPGLARCGQGVQFIQTGEENRFASDKRNLGIQLAKGQVLLFLDDDCIPYPDWLEKHLARQAQGWRVVGGSVELARRSYLQLADNLSAFHFMTSDLPAGERAYLCTANLSVDRSVVERTGLMETHRNRAEDLEWTARFHRLGFRLYFEPQALALHDPKRHHLVELWEHWVADAPATLRVRLQYAAELGTPRLARHRGLYLWGAPFIAAWATWRIFARRAILQAYWHTIPVVYWTKLVWCWGAFRDGWR